MVKCKRSIGAVATAVLLLGGGQALAQAPAAKPGAQAQEAPPSTPTAGETATTAAPAGIPAAAPPAVSAPASSAPAAAEAGNAEAAAGGETVDVAGISPLVEDIRTVGPWSDGERSGIWRTIMIQQPQQPDASRFYVQKIESAGGLLTVLATTEIEEIAGLDGVIVDFRADEPSEGDSNSLTLFFDIVPLDGEIADTYELHFLGDAPYMFGPASN